MKPIAYYMDIVRFAVFGEHTFHFIEMKEHHNLCKREKKYNIHPKKYQQYIILRK